MEIVEIGKPEWYQDKEIHCGWKNAKCDVKPELRPMQLCVCCLLGELLGNVRVANESLSIVSKN